MVSSTRRRRNDENEPATNENRNVQPTANEFAVALGISETPAAKKVRKSSSLLALEESSRLGNRPPPAPETPAMSTPSVRTRTPNPELSDPSKKTFLFDMFRSDGGSSRSCSYCGDLGHYAKACPNRPKCSRCDYPGHSEDFCPLREMEARNDVKQIDPVLHRRQGQKWTLEEMRLGLRVLAAVRAESERTISTKRPFDRAAFYFIGAWLRLGSPKALCAPNGLGKACLTITNREQASIWKRKNGLSAYPKL